MSYIIADGVLLCVYFATDLFWLVAWFMVFSVTWTDKLFSPSMAILIILLYCQYEVIQDVLCTALCDQVCQLLATDRWFSPSTPVF
jgi:hypothetical protein